MELVRQHDIEMQLEELSQSARPGTFYLQARELAQDALEQGFDRKELLEAYEHFASALRNRDQEAQEDELIDVIDQLEGWCASHVRL